MGKPASTESADDRISRLFARLTAIVEDAHELTIEGQNPAASVSERKNLLRRLNRRLTRCDATVAAIATLLQL
jgi:hypothetical protein